MQRETFQWQKSTLCLDKSSTVHPPTRTHSTRYHIVLCGKFLLTWEKDFLVVCCTWVNCAERRRSNSKLPLATVQIHCASHTAPNYKCRFLSCAHILFSTFIQSVRFDHFFVSIHSVCLLLFFILFPLLKLLLNDFYEISFADIWFCIWWN